jgi:type I restriction enzyme M protein
MLDTDTKRRIDTARDILVGKVPDPKSQVEQITIALIYKFMDDMDAESEEFGGRRKFFAGEFARYGWAKLMRTGLGGHEILNLYAEAIAKMPENPGIPLLFRDIFKNAYLPYRDPETLRAFLKVIDEFEYDHSERLGDAFEYLLSVLGSQGDAGQFRTPRHIIDFIVSIIDPKKNETVLDPACGTAGFLISSFKHILKANTDAKGHSTLTPDDRGRLAVNFKGYDISPDMVRLSLVNLYLHGFTDPHIFEYDTLTSQDRWNEYADVILANPPFMSPKGGIKPHNRFSVQSKRSEVLFVDYMAEHLTPTGRAGIIVPEGIIFQSQTAYIQLRKMLIEEYLIGVISLPSGVFMPYTGVKTSILVLDRVEARRNPNIMFSDIRQIGFSLGVKRTPTEHNHLPFVLSDYHAYRSGGELSCHSWLARREAVLEGDANLTGTQYRTVEINGSHRFATVGELCRITKGSFSSTKTPPGSYRLVLTAAESKTADSYDFEGPSVCVPLISSLGHGKAALHRIHYAEGKFALANLLVALQPVDASEVDARFLYFALDARRDVIAGLMQGAANVSMKPEDLAQFEIPLPPLDTQKEIVAEMEGYQRVIDGARAVLDNYRPHIPIHPEWPMVELGEHFTTSSGGTPSKANPSYWRGSIPWVSPKDMKSNLILDTEDHISEEAVAGSATKLFPAKTVVCVVRSGILRHSFPVALLARPMCTNQDLIAFQPKGAEVLSEFLFYVLKTHSALILAEGIKPGVTVQSFHNGFFKDYKIPVPPLETQHTIVAEVEAEQALVNANRELIARFEKKIQATLARVWGQEAQAPSYAEFPKESFPLAAETSPIYQFEDRAERGQAPLSSTSLTPSQPQPVPARILTAMHPDRELSRSEILESTGISEADWTWAIRQLKEQRAVVQRGEKRGARYVKVSRIN